MQFGQGVLNACSTESGCIMSLPVVHSHAHAHISPPQLRRKPVTASQPCCGSQKSAAPLYSLKSGSTFRGQELGCRQLPARSGRITLQATARQGGGDRRREEASDGFQERVVQVRRVTKVVKGGKQLSFRYSQYPSNRLLCWSIESIESQAVAVIKSELSLPCRCVVIVGDEKGQVGVGCASAKEVVQAVAKAVVRAKTELVRVPLTNASTFPHRIDGYFGAAKVMLRPASEGTGVIAGGAVRVVLELAGVKNGFGKQLGSPNPLNNARAALVGLSEMRTLKQVAAQRDMTIEELMSRAKGGMLPDFNRSSPVLSLV